LIIYREGTIVSRGFVAFFELPQLQQA